MFPGFKLKSIRMREALLCFFLGSTLFSGLLITILAFRNELEMGHNYAHEIGNQLSSNVVSQIEYSVEETEEFVKTQKLYLERRHGDPAFFQLMIRSFGEHLSQNTSLGSVAYAEVETGYALMVHPPFAFVNKQNYRPGSIGAPPLQGLEDQIIVQELKPIKGKPKSFLANTYKLMDFPDKVMFSEELGGFDYRDRPWYLAGKNAPDHAGVSWTHTYPFIMRAYQGNSNGITCAAKILDRAGKMTAIIGMDISTNWLSDYLEYCMSKIGRQGLQAFVFEKKDDGAVQVIAHSNKADIFPLLPNGQLHFLCKPEELKSQVVKDLLDHIPAEFYEAPDPGNSEMLKFTSQGMEYVGMAKDVLPGRPPNWVTCIYISKTHLFSKAYNSFKWNIVCVFLVMVASGLISLYLARATSRPLEGLAKVADRIGKLDFHSPVTMDSVFLEVKELSGAIHRMKIGLESFTRYLPKDLLRALFETGQGARPGGSEQFLTISFTDVVDFTKYAEKLPPNELVCQLNEYLGCFSSVISEQDGTVDKFIGDAVMAYWNAPNPCEDHAFKACKAAIRGMERLALLQKEWLARGMSVFMARVGINTGHAIVGNIGIEQHLNYTVVGDNVNLASRLEGLNRNYGTKILITESTLTLVRDRVISRPIDMVAVKGKGIRVMVHELMGLKGETSEEVVLACEEFARAYAMYMGRNWEGARQVFEKLAAAFAADPLPKLFAQRCAEFMVHPPPDSWDGSQEMRSK